MLSGPDHLAVLYMSRDSTQDDLLHNPSWHQGQTDRPVVPQIILLLRTMAGAVTTEHSCPLWLSAA